MAAAEGVAPVLCVTVDQFEREERRWRAERARELTRRGLTAPQIAERLGLDERSARRYVRRYGCSRT